ncbi:MAG TPA: MMPL family transporter, partial [Paracoccaceae bacterium]|nr:MMPL family transporter [Paracoccaceae bacterium]
GMMAIAFGGVGQFVVFGISSAAGVFAALVFTVVVLPVLLEFWHPHPVVTKPKRKTLWRSALRLFGMPFRAIGWVAGKTGLRWLLGATWLQPQLDKIPAVSYAARYPIIAVFAALFAICAYGASQVRIDTNLVEVFREGTTLRQTYEIVDEHMAGTGAMEVMLDFDTLDAMTDPNVLKAIDGFQNLLEDKYSRYVVRTNSLADLVKETHRIMRDGDAQYYSIPDDPLAVSQLLYLFNSSNPEDRQMLVSDDYSRSHIAIQMRNAGSSEYAAFFDEMNADLDASFAPLLADYPAMTTEVTGSVAVLMRMMDVISQSQFKSLTTAVIIISMIMMLTLGSIQGGLLSIVPNMLPAVLAFGLMGLFGVPLDTDTLMIAPLIIGIAVDDTIHFVTHYRMALARGRTMEEALKQTIREVGQAVTFTSLVLGCGFFMLTFSDYLGLAKVGSFGSLAIFVALLCDLLFLPALIYVFRPRFGIKPGTGKVIEGTV